MFKKEDKRANRVRRHARVRKKISGTTERPRLSVYRVTLVSASSVDKDFDGVGSNKDAAVKVGVLVAKKALDKGIKAVVFDRGGYIYHGRIEALAQAAREAGLEF